MSPFFAGAVRAGKRGRSPLGTYLMTLTTADRAPLLGHCLDGKSVQLSTVGRAVLRQLTALASFEQTVARAEAAVLPNHIHCLFTLRAEAAGEGEEMPDFAALAAAVKRRAEEEYAYYTSGGTPHLWDPGYRVEPVLDEKERDAARAMLRDNAANWMTDEYYIAPRGQK